MTASGTAKLSSVDLSANSKAPNKMSRAAAMRGNMPPSSQWWNTAATTAANRTQAGKIEGSASAPTMLTSPQKPSGLRARPTAFSTGNSMTKAMKPARSVTGSFHSVDVWRPSTWASALVAAMRQVPQPMTATASAAICSSVPRAPTPATTTAFSTRLPARAITTWTSFSGRAVSAG